MKDWMFVAVSMLASASCGADEPSMLAPAPHGWHLPDFSPEVRKRILQQKTAELYQLQDEILRLNGSISHPIRVRTTIRVIEIDGVKLKKNKLSDPFLADEAEAKSLMTGKYVTFDSDSAVVRAIEPLVTSGCAKVLVSPTLITAVGETSVVNCYREFPHTEESEAESKQTELSDGNRLVPGYRVIVRAVIKEDGDIGLAVGCRVSTEDPASTIKINGQAKIGVNSISMQTTYALKSGVPAIAGGSMISWNPAVANSVGKRWAVVPAALKPKGAEMREAIRTTYFQITTERLPDDAIDSGSLH